MTENIIDAAIATLPQETKAPEAEVINPPVAEETQTETPDPKAETPEAESDKSDDVIFPKKAVNAISRRDKQIGKLRAEAAALQAELAKYTQSQAQTPKNQNAVIEGSPKEEDFDNYSDFLEAKLLHKIKQEQTAQEKTKQEQAQAAQKQEWVNGREQDIAQKASIHKEEIPDFVEVMQEYADIADEFPEHIVQAFYEADDGSMAFYNLAKDGKLEALATMSPYKAAMEIAMAQNKKSPVVNRVSNAPAPISAAKGSGSSSKSLDSMNWSEMKQFLKS